MIEILKSLAPEFVGGLMAIMCAVIGAKIATKSSERREHKKELIDAYSEVFANFYVCARNPSDEHKMRFVVSIERAGLICSTNSEKLMQEMIFEFTEEEPNINKITKLARELHISAKEDAINAKRKKYRTKYK